MIPLVLALLLALPGQAADSGPSAWQDSYTLETKGDYAGAIAALTATPEARQPYVYPLRVGWLRYLAGEHEAAITAYERAVAAEPRAVEPLLGLMLPQLALRRWQDAEATARKALALDADNGLATGRLAWALYNLGRHGEAEAAYRRGLALYPGDVDLRAGLGWSLLQQGKESAARKEFEAVLAIAPYHAAALSGLETTVVER